MPLAALAGGVAALGYAAGYEVRSYRLRRVEVPVLKPGSRPLRVLHVSDLHLTPGQQRKREWVRALAGLEPDLVINTGDNLAHQRAVPAVLDALGPLLERPGVFVLGSNDYYEPIFKNPARYLLPNGGPSLSEPPAAVGRPARRADVGRLAGPEQRPHAGSRPTTARSRWSAPMTRTSGGTGTPRSPDPPTPPRTSPWVSCTRRTAGCWTR